MRKRQDSSGRRSSWRRSPRWHRRRRDLIAILGGEGLNVSFMVGLAFAIAASANFPAMLLALTWPRFNTTGAVTGVLFGVVTALGLIIISPVVWSGPPGAPDTGAFSGTT